jgi:hypothetical protein
VAIALVGTALAVLTGAQGPLGGFWGAPSSTELGIDGALLGAFVGYGVIEALGFGLGIAWLVNGRSMLGRGGLAAATYVAIGWALVSWFPHGALHQSIDEHDYGALIRIEYGFHATMLLAAAVVAVYVWRSLRAGEAR